MHLFPVVADNDDSLNEPFDLTMFNPFNEIHFAVEALSSLEHAPFMTHLGDRATRRETVVHVLKVDRLLHRIGKCGYTAI